MNNDTYECDLCRQSFDTRNALEEHVEEAHTKEL